jgi:hypothetical protein
MSTGNPFRSGRGHGCLYFCIGFAVVFAVLSTIVVGFLVVLSLRATERSLLEQASARHLSALVETRGGTLEIFNGDAADWTNCRLLANGQFSTQADRIAANKIHKIPLIQFIADDGRRFQPLQQAVVKLEIRADQGVWSGELAR